MNAPAATFTQGRGLTARAPEIVAALPYPVLLIDKDNEIVGVNGAAEGFLGGSATVLEGRPLHAALPEKSPLFYLIEKVRRSGAALSEHALDIGVAPGAEQRVAVYIGPLDGGDGALLICLQPRGVTSAIDRRLSHRGAARSVAGVAAILAHEIKNPLSGIRGAAQLLEDGSDGERRDLTRLICKEADRIVSLVDQMEVFSDDRPPEFAAENIHKILDHVIAVARAGFGRGVDIRVDYDPSLPDVDGNAPALTQLFLNLVKNAAEAAAGEGAEIHVVTRYHHGLKLAPQAGGEALALPIEVRIADNGPGLSDSVRDYIFDPFVSTKRDGKGLGLALVSKIVSDHGGAVDCDREGDLTVFTVLLPARRTEALS